MRTKRWIAVAAALLCSLQAAAVQAEAAAHHRYIFQKSFEITASLRKMAASEGYLPFLGPDSPGVKELAERVAAVDLEEPDTVVVIGVAEELPELMLRLMIASLMNKNPSTDFSLFDDRAVKETLMAQIPLFISSAWLSGQGVDWIVLSNCVTISGMDDLPEGLSSHTFVAFVYREEQVIYLVSFLPNERWQFVSYFAKLMPYDPSMSVDMIGELINIMLPGCGTLIMNGLQITTFTGKEIADLLLE